MSICAGDNYQSLHRKIPNEYSNYTSTKCIVSFTINIAFGLEAVHEQEIILHAEDFNHHHISYTGWYRGSWGQLLIVAAISIFLFIRYLSPKKLKEVIIDERTYRIQEKASVMAIQIFALTALYIGATLIFTTSKTDNDFRQLGLTLLFSVCGLILLRLILHFYYSRKF